MPGWSYAFALPREAVKAATPPGTVALIDHNAAHQNGEGADRIVKIPTPSDDPADPLNWPKWRKVACMVTISFYAFVSNYISASMAPALPVWNQEFRRDRRPLSDLMQLVAFNVLVLGLGNIIWVPLANIFGRRLVLVLSTLVLFVATAFGTHTTGFTPTLTIRIFQGFGSSASETVTPAVVGDLFFVHERGGWMAFYTASLASGSVVGGITGGYVAAELGWVMQFWIGAALTGVAHLLTFLLVPETMYDRGDQELPIQRRLPRVSLDLWQSREPPPVRYSMAPVISLGTLPSMRFSFPSRLSSSSHRDSCYWMTWYDPDSSVDLPSTAGGPGREAVAAGHAAQARRQTRQSNRWSRLAMIDAGTQTYPESIIGREPAERYPPYTFARSLKFSPYRGRALYHFTKPWGTLRLPATWVIMLQYGGLVGGVAVISTVGPQLLTRRPYRWGENAGLLFVGALIGILLGGVWTGFVADRRTKQVARDQDWGYAEPEARLPVMVPALAIGTGGLLVFGYCAQYPSRSAWVGLETAYGMVAFALTQVPSVWFSYLIDAYGQLASDCFVMVNILRGAIPFAWTFFVAQWVQKDGYVIPFGGFTAIMAAFSLLIVPIIYLGKRMRIATARYVHANQ